jgi:peptidoglycan/LPS O-acetylase OafA/YrhL
MTFSPGQSIAPSARVAAISAGRRVSTTRIESLTFLRFVAALIVVIYHYGRGMDLAPLAILSGPQMVTFFFVLSGFVLSVGYYSRPPSLKAFYLARAARILPAYLLALALFWHLSGNSKETTGSIPLFLHLTFLQSWFPAYATTLNVPAWSLSVEVFFYVTFPILLFLIRRWNASTRWLFSMAVATWLGTQLLLVYLFNSGCFGASKSICHDLIMYFPLFHFCSFVLGVAGGCALIEIRSAQGQRRGMLVPILTTFLSIVLLLQRPDAYVKPLGLTIPLEASFYGPVFLMFILAIALANNWLTRVLSLPPLTLLGNASYALYILQVPVHKAYGEYVGSRFNLSDLQEFIFYLALLILVSFVTLYVVE